ncbi:DUF1353 domain-containing protein [Chloroflexota bacterium]
MSEFTNILEVSPLGDGENWILRKGFAYYEDELDEKRYWINVPPKFMTDYASVPPVFRSLIAKWGKHGNATIIHDYLYWTQERSRKDADKIFRNGMVVFKVNSLKVFLIFWSVRLGGYFAWRGNIRKRENGYNRVAARWPEKATDTPADLQVAEAEQKE